MPDYWDWDKKYPNICNEVRDVRKVGKCDQIETFAFDVGVPISFYGPAN
jgi:hypothetical protein